MQQHRLLVHPDVHTLRGQHPLGVIARARRLDDFGLDTAAQRGEHDAALHLGTARLVGPFDVAHRGTAHRHRQAAVRRELDRRAIAESGLAMRRIGDR
jgi:hypothetical protein